MKQLSLTAEKELGFIQKSIDNLSFISEADNELKTFLNSSQKRIRSLLAILYFKSQNKTFDPKILELLTAAELIHNASLLHDDIIDYSKTRRGILTIGEKFSPAVSILSGDWLMTRATQKIFEFNNPEITNIFLDCAVRMAKAETKETLFRGKIPDEKTYLEICEGKTASLFSAILKSCAVYFNTDIKKAEVFGTKFGLIFQIKNDLEPHSADTDEMNGIYTAEKIFGIEKTLTLSDNYLRELREMVSEFPDGMYKKALEDLLLKL